MVFNGIGMLNWCRFRFSWLVCYRECLVIGNSRLELGRVKIVEWKVV